MLIKICGLKTKDDVAAAVDAGANAVGFVFVESPRKVTVDEALLACESVSNDVLRVAVMKQPMQELVDKVLREFKPDVLQTDAEDLSQLDLPSKLKRWPVFRQGVSEPEIETIPTRPLIDEELVFLYEGQASGSGEPIDWTIAADYADVGRMILAGGLNPENVAEAIERSTPWGVDVSSGVESSRGKKDHDKIYAFVKTAKAAMRKT